MGWHQKKLSTKYQKLVEPIRVRQNYVEANEQKHQSKSQSSVECRSEIV